MRPWRGDSAQDPPGPQSGCTDEADITELAERNPIGGHRTRASTPKSSPHPPCISDVRLFPGRQPTSLSLFPHSLWLFNQLSSTTPFLFPWLVPGLPDGHPCTNFWLWGDAPIFVCLQWSRIWTGQEEGAVHLFTFKRMLIKMSYFINRTLTFLYSTFNYCYTM